MEHPPPWLRRAAAELVARAAERRAAHAERDQALGRREPVVQVQAALDAEQLRLLEDPRLVGRVPEHVVLGRVQAGEGARVAAARCWAPLTPSAR
jgi:hypothetical protein